MLLAFVATMNAYVLPTGRQDKASDPGLIGVWWNVPGLHRQPHTLGRYVYAPAAIPRRRLSGGYPGQVGDAQAVPAARRVWSPGRGVKVSRLNAGTIRWHEHGAVLNRGRGIAVVALSGGSGTVLGSVMGALIVQFLESGRLCCDVSYAYPW